MMGVCPVAASDQGIVYDCIGHHALPLHCVDALGATSEAWIPPKYASKVRYQRAGMQKRKNGRIVFSGSNTPAGSAILKVWLTCRSSSGKLLVGAIAVKGGYGKQWGPCCVSAGVMTTIKSPARKCPLPSHFHGDSIIG